MVSLCVFVVITIIFKPKVASDLQPSVIVKSISLGFAGRIKQIEDVILQTKQLIS